MFCVDNTFKHDYVFNSKMRVVKSLNATAKKLDRILPFSIGEKSNATTSLSSVVWVTYDMAPV